MKFKTIYLIGLSFSLSSATLAQTVPVGLLDNSDDYYRRQQLLGNDTSSYMIRPMKVSGANELNRELYRGNNGKVTLHALPVIWQQQYNSDHPYGINDGAMISARGYQTLFSAGVKANLGPLSIQLRPEFVFAENKDFTEVLEAKNSDFIKTQYRNLLNVIDLPERIGSRAYTKINWGQSNIRLNAGPVSLGLSNENVWWGPGTRNSLLMTNNAGGFKHLTLNTIRPIQTPIGSFEAQIIAGRLENTGITGQYIGSRSKLDDWRYLSGLSLNYQPKWVPGLYLGLQRSFIVYRSQMGSGFGDYFPFLSGVTKDNFAVEGGGKDEEDLKSRDQLISLSARWLFQDAKAEIYVEYGREDHSKDIRDFFVEPEHDRAYVFGFRKLFELDAIEGHIQTGFEFTHFENSITPSVRAPVIWYTHTQVRDGYTSNGQLLGAGITPGSNAQTFDWDWVNGWNRVGIRLERIVHNNVLYDRELGQKKGDKNQWTDLGISARYDKELGKFILNSQLTYIKSHNYQWALPGSTENSANNIQLRIGLMYRW